MRRILAYSLRELLKGRWIIMYALFFFLVSLLLLFMGNNLSKAILSLLNIVVVLVPLMSILLGAMFVYSTREFTELLLSQPIRRTDIFYGEFLGVALSQSFALIFGLALPFVFYGLFVSSQIWEFAWLLFMSIVLTFIFSSIGFLIALWKDNKMMVFGLSLFFWMFMVIIYDGIFLLYLLAFKEYPLETSALAAIIINPVDLARTQILLKLDSAALLGYTGAVFSKFFSSTQGTIAGLGVLALWVILPVLGIGRKARRKDF